MKSGRSFAYNGEAGSIHFVVDAVTPFWIIKAHTRSRYEAMPEDENPEPVKITYGRSQ
jgi:hypothetical protein